MKAIRRVLENVHWYLKELTGEARWDDYLRHCAEHGHQPMTRREFERRRADALAATAINRCC